MQQDHCHEGSAQPSGSYLDFNNAAIASDGCCREQHRRLDNQARDELRQRAAEIAQAILGPPNPKLCKWNSRQWRWGRKGSLVLNVTGDKAGLWYDHENGVGGDIIDFIAHQHGWSIADAIRWALDYLGNCFPRTAWGPPAPRQPEPDDARRIEEALEYWTGAEPLRRTLADLYLAKRGIEVPEVALAVLGFHPFCRFGYVTAPALVALIEDIITCEPVGIHRGCLTSKADRHGPWMSLGPKSGGAIKLATPDNGKLVIGEGLVTCLSGMQLGYGPTWSVLDAGGVGDFPVLDYIHHLTVLVDHDKSKIDQAGREIGLVGQRAAAMCCERWLAAGKVVTLLTPDTPGHDLNDVLLLKSPVTVLTRSP